MEHVERREERERELRGDADRLERTGDELDERTDQLQHEIDEAREDFERKQQSEDVPGAQEPGGTPEGSGPPPEAEIAPGDDAA